MTRHAITLRINGESWPVEVAPRELLLEVLRTRLGVTSTKVGCERGDCGSCTVLVDGRTVRSCLVLAVEADGAEIGTLEGVGAAGLTPLQRQLLDHGAFQCGYCAPGMILAAQELLDQRPHPSRAEVQEALAGNLCRCTGYVPIVDAVLAAAGARRDTRDAHPGPGPGAGEV